MKKKFVILAAGVMSAVALTACGKTKIDLDQYVDVKYEGYDTIGTATVEFDYKHFVRDYEEDLKLTKEGEDERKEMKEAAAALGLDKSAADLLATYLKGELDKTEGLSNGDTITFTWDLDESEIQERFKCEITFSDITCEVEGLEEATAFDPFEGYEVTFTGMAPAGRIEVNNNVPSSNPRLNYEFSKSEGLSNGDVVKVTVNAYGYDLVPYCVENYGMIPTVTEKEFTVEGLATYLQSASDISEDVLAKMQKQCEDIFTADAVPWNAASYLGCEYLGCYFLTPKNANGYGNQNECTLVYRLDAHVNYDDGKFETNTSYYYGVTFFNIMELADGTQSVDLSNYNKRNQYNGHQVGTGFTSWGSEIMVRFNGYDSLDAMFSELVTSKVENWNYENTVEDKAPFYPVEEAPAEGGEENAEPAAE